MSAHGGDALAVPYDDAEQQRRTGELGMWVFLSSELLLFGGVFMAYLVYRTWYPDAFETGGDHALVVLGTLNTVLLLVGSFAVAVAVRAAEEGRRSASVRGFVTGAALGAVFLGLKGYEYVDHARHGLWPGDGFSPGGERPEGLALYFAVYFVGTGIHALHLLVGMGLVLAAALAVRRGTVDARRPAFAINAGLYWHFVDALWVFLFALFYLQGRS